MTEALPFDESPFKMYSACLGNARRRDEVVLGTVEVSAATRTGALAVVAVGEPVEAMSPSELFHGLDVYCHFLSKNA